MRLLSCGPFFVRSSGVDDFEAAVATYRAACLKSADFVAEVFCPSECVRLIQDQASMRNVDSRIHSLRFDCCVFLFYSFSTVTFATKSATSGLMHYSKRREKVAILT